MQGLSVRQVEDLIERATHRVSFYYGGGDGGNWAADLRAVVHYHLTGKDEPDWHREIYGDLGPWIDSQGVPTDQAKAITLESVS